jgi:hypothetical protein
MIVANATSTSVGADGLWVGTDLPWVLGWRIISRGATRSDAQEAANVVLSASLPSLPALPCPFVLVSDFLGWSFAVQRPQLVIELP